MIRLRLQHIALFGAFFAASACVPDDVKDSGGAATTSGGEEADSDTDTDSDTDSDSDADTDSDTDADAIVGDWLSQGGDLAPAFAGIDTVSASFQSNGNYSVVITVSGTPYSCTGTYEVDTSTTPHSITLLQDTPRLTTEGIWQVSGSTMTYEVVQTDPDDGYVAPTPSTGFGSSQGEGFAPGDLTQTYQKQ